MTEKISYEIGHSIEILNLLLIDRTTNSNIIWANDNYSIFDAKEFNSKSKINVKHIVNNFGSLVIPRAFKTDILKHGRKKENAEVFTPQMIVKKQNDMIESQFSIEDFETTNYINKIWLEITCGEGPYITTRYNMENGKFIPLEFREGFLDRKFKKIKYVKDKDKWFELVIKSYKATYGFEWNGDSLFIARLNLLNTFRENYIEKWELLPTDTEIITIANIISYNIFQMDGIKCIIPLSDSHKTIVSKQFSLFGELEDKDEVVRNKGIRVKIKNWKTNDMEFFDEVKYETQ